MRHNVCRDFGVALRKESVDRNARLNVLTMLMSESLSARRAWIEISRARIQYCPQPSLSARRAWIEMDWASVISAMTSVALRKESVDRNHAAKYRRIPLLVALRKESVDRNFYAFRF